MRLQTANVITVGRTLLALVAAWPLLQPPPWPLVGALALAVAVLLDVADGVVARRLGLADHAGALADASADHITAAGAWIALAYAGAVPVAVPILTVARDFVVDWFREVEERRGVDPLRDVGDPWSWLWHGRPLRLAYGAAKLLAWIFGAGYLAGIPVGTVAVALAWLAVALAMLRAVPAVRRGWRTLFLVR
ncbi:MAG: CDP-alcohol phosphatidyltransferase family protein [Chloroflexi bacterium]|nr:CDP-alcohol phosphatidyltransferase family protein [Chloroflexota bacterium]